VEEVLLIAAEQSAEDSTAWNPAVLRANAYWDSLNLTIKTDTQPAVVQWLKELFSPRFDEENGIILESQNGHKRYCRVVFEEDDIPIKTRPFLPTLSRPRVIGPASDQRANPDPFKDEEPPVIAFHSFKGGVGRTLHALALARAIERDGGAVLIVDGDLEAPGISWLLEKRLPEPPVSYSDFLALAQSSEDALFTDAINLTAHRLKGSRMGNIYVLPSFRNRNRWNTLEIRPEHLLNNQHPFQISDLLAALGHKLGVSAVIVDLRAGLTELSSGLILDPRVNRVFVTSASGQSVMGACEVLKLLSRYAPSYKDHHPDPSVIISLIPKEIENAPDETGENRLKKAAEKLILKESGDDTEINISFSPFNQNLLSIPLDWEKAIQRIDDSSLRESILPILEALPVGEGNVAGVADQGTDHLLQRRKNLAELAEKLEYAESGEGEIFIRTGPLRNLAENFRAQLPNALLVGAKGAGKTYTFLQLAKIKKWSQFVDEFASKGGDGSQDAHLFPFLYPKNLKLKARTILSEAEKSAIPEERLGIMELRDEINQALKKSEPLSDGEWRMLWLDLIARRLGGGEEKGLGSTFPKKLAEKNTSIVLLIDGLEDLFQNIDSSQQQQTALRVLLQDVPEWLSQSPEQTLGILVFIRQDLVSYAIKQNHGQFMKLHKPYWLQWHETEALRLAAIISVEAGALKKPENEDLSAWDFDQLNKFLAGLWGHKLGSAKSREARSSRWILDVLSDLKQQMQARDLVRLIRESAQSSAKDASETWNDRILTPNAIRASIDLCSQEKIKEIRAENPLLNSIFKKILRTDLGSRLLPFQAETLGLSAAEVETLEKNGVVLVDELGLLMPEIYRRGLKFNNSAPGRVKVRNLKRKALRRNREG